MDSLYHTHWTAGCANGRILGQSFCSRGHENIRKLLEVNGDRILHVKLADRLHNIRTIDGHASLAKQKKIAEETLQFFVPMAKSLGLTLIAEELKERSFKVLHCK